MDYVSTVVSLNKDLFSIFSVRDNLLLKCVMYIADAFMKPYTRNFLI